MYVPIRGKSNDVTKMYVPLEEGITANVIKGYCPKNGMGELFFRGWKNESTLPFDFFKGAAVIHEGKIHILGGENNPRAHYAWDAETNTWSRMSYLPYDFIFGSAASYKGRIHIFGQEGGWNTQHYLWDSEYPNVWVQAQNTPYAFFNNNNAQIYNDKISLVSSGYGSYSQFRYIQQWDDQAWTSFYNNPSANSYANSAVYKGMIYLLGNSGTGGTNYQTWDGSTFSGMVKLPNYTFRNGYALTYKNRIHLLGNGASSNSKNHYSFDGTTLRKESRLPCRFNLCPAVVYKNRIHILGSPDDRRAHFSWGKSYLIGEYTPGQNYTLDVPLNWEVDEFIYDAIEKYIAKNKDYTESPEIFEQLIANIDNIVDYFVSYKGNRRGLAIKFQTGIAYQKLWMLNIKVQYVDTPMDLLIVDKHTENGETYYTTNPFVAAAFTGEPAYDATIWMDTPMEYSIDDTGMNVSNIGYKFDYFSNYGFYDLNASNLGMFEN